MSEMTRGAGRTIALATLVAGTLDILSASVYAMIAGRTPVQMLRGVSGAILGAGKDGAMAPLVGLALHFAIMAVMAAVFVLAARRMPLLLLRPLSTGVGYGLVTWAVMNLVVLPLRFGWHPFKPLGLAEQFFSHIVLVGLPIAWFARK